MSQTPDRAPENGSVKEVDCAEVTQRLQQEEDDEASKQSPVKRSKENTQDPESAPTSVRSSQAAKDDAGQTHSPAKSTTSTTNNSVKGGPPRLRKKDPNAPKMSIETFDKASRQPTIDSPRSVLALAQEGIDPTEDLGHREPRDFLKLAKNNRDLAKLRLAHYNERRDEIISVVVRRRERLIADQQSTVPLPEHVSSSAEPSPAAPQRAQTPTVRPSQAPASATDETQATTRPTHSTVSPRDQTSTESSPRKSRSVRSTSVTSVTSGSTNRSSTAFGGLPHEEMTPEAMQRAEAEHRKNKVLREVERMKKVLEQNERREKLQQLHADKLKARFEAQEEAAARRRDRMEEDRLQKMADQRRKDAEMKVQRERMAAQRAQKEADRRAEREAAIQRMDERDREREAKRRQQLVETEIEAAEKAHLVKLRLESIKEHADEQTDEKQREMLERIRQADEQREQLRIRQDAELLARKIEGEEKAQKTAGRRKRAVEEYEGKLGRFKARGMAAEDKRVKLKEQKEHLMVLRRLEEAKKAEERQEILKGVEESHEKRGQELLESMHQAEERAKVMADERQKVSERRAVEKDMIIQDRIAQVKRNRRIVDHQALEAEEQFLRKLSKIDRLQQDAKQADEERRRLQHKALLARKPPKVTPTPGPLDYDAVHADKFANDSRGGVRFMTGGRVKLSTMKGGDSPGPGHYAIDANRKIKGAKLPPKQLDVETLVSIARSRMSATPSPSRGPGRVLLQPLDATSNSLALTKPNTAPHGSALASPMAASKNQLLSTTGSSGSSLAPAAAAPPLVDRPPGVQDEDYDSADDFDVVA